MPLLSLYQGMPFIPPDSSPEDLDDYADTISRLDSEFAFCPDLSPGMVASLMEAGFLPMAHAFLVGRNSSRQGEAFVDYGIPKLHVERSVLQFHDQRIEKSTVRRSRSWGIAWNNCFDEVLDRCVRTHDDGWLRPELCESFRQLHAKRLEGNNGCECFELYDLDSGDLIAGEVGYRVGAMYTSLSGYFERSGAGSAQLAATGRILRARGDLAWDLGMGLPYKERLGARLLSAAEFLALFRTARDAKAPSPTWASTVKREKSEAVRLDALLDGARGET